MLAALRCIGLALCAILLGACQSYPAAEDVAACAASKFGTEHGTFTVAQRSKSLLTGTTSAITYQKRANPDRAIAIYNQSNGLVSTHQHISYGNHAEINGAVEAIRFCAETGGKREPGS